MKGLLYAATETQVWVSFDDGDHWHSLRLDMPAVSVRDIQLKDDDSCLCSDLIAGTHGRGFWILDNVTPLRQAAKAAAASEAYLFEPATAVRVRYGMNDPTEWPPELPHGENPPMGGVIDYYLAANARGPVRLDVLDANGKVVRAYSSDDPVLKPDPALDPAGYDKVCQQDPTAPDCRVPLYWPAPQMVVETTKGMHRFSWDLRYQPIGPEPRAAGGATGAVPEHTFPPATTPWAPPGRYTVRLTVNGQTYTQPLTLKLDPRVQTPVADLAHVADLSREMYDGAVAAHAAYERARGARDGARRGGRPGRGGLQGRGREAGAGAAPAVVRLLPARRAVGAADAQRRGRRDDGRGHGHAGSGSRADGAPGRRVRRGRGAVEGRDGQVGAAVDDGAVAAEREARGRRAGAHPDRLKPG